MTSNNLTIAGLFSGVGGIETAFNNTGFTPLWANEFDPKPSETFRLNHPDTALHELPIQDLDTSTLQAPTTLVGGSPCQAFSVAGYKRGFEDERGNLFFQYARVLEDLAPESFLFENVRNLQSHDSGRTFSIIQETFSQLGYHTRTSILSPHTHSFTPQTRPRIFIVGFKDSHRADQFTFPAPTDPQDPRRLSVRDVLEHDPEDRKYYYGQDFPYHDVLVQSITNPNHAYQWRRKYVRENKSGVFPTLTANMGTGGHNVPLILTDTGEIRKLTPKECFNVQGNTNILLPQQANSHLYKQAGNSVAVDLIERIAQQMKEVLV